MYIWKFQKMFFFDIAIFKNRTKTDQQCQGSKMRIWWQGSTRCGVCRHLLYTLREKRLPNGLFVLINTRPNITGTEARLLYQKDSLENFDLFCKYAKKIIIKVCSNNKKQPTWKKTVCRKIHQFGWVVSATVLDPCFSTHPLALPTIPAAFATPVYYHSVPPHAVPPPPGEGGFGPLRAGIPPVGNIIDSKSPCLIGYWTCSQEARNTIL